MARPLLDIIAALEDLSPPQDPESTHIEADRLLLEAIDRLAPEVEAERIREAWRNVPKWYA